ncbi:hypothetical protein EJ02DRAFT_382759, partial [Clathrospora elynae]
MPSLHCHRVRKRPRDAPKPKQNPNLDKENLDGASSSCLTYRQRIEILTLSNYAGWNPNQISSTLNIAWSTVWYTIKKPETPEKPRGSFAT